MFHPFTGEDELAMADAGAGGRDAVRRTCERRVPLQNVVLAAPRIPSYPSTRQVSPNAACPCGSGKKYKDCHGKHE